ncbi:hypothetical protein [Alkalilimnicola sp. S0819]|uniref:hypothetical protein n=1 Tax=Alkalilimnicola sp. S0819 TaxID=2613922 RepID=UPI001261A602|nr:hypothetical protein [Alkalilimnicola sp. S0819]KAB7624390.1 hypothetical protein F3N43_06170 [Alkalilimnicola sp. S0819]MPQ16217.1 hypothetical protein [Alkalilimnicola sp. S0819]
MKKLVIATTALGLVLSGAALAQDSYNVAHNSVALFGSAAFDDGNANAVDNSAAVSGSLNENDLSTDNSVEGSLNADVSDSGNTDNSVNGTGNLALSNSLNTTVRDSGNIENSGNLGISVDAAVAWSDLDGTVANNTSTTVLSSDHDAHNCVSGGFANAAGVTQFQQNAAPNALTQQDVVVQANMRLSSAN